MEFIIYHLPLAEGNQDPFNFLLSFKDAVAKIDKSLINGLSKIDGIDSIVQVGRYTLSISVGRCFDALNIELLIRDSISKFEGGPVLSLPKKNLIVAE